MGFYKKASKGKQGHHELEQHRQQLFRCSRLILQLFCSLLLKGAAVAFIFEWNSWKEVREKIIMIILKKSRSNLSAAGVLDGGTPCTQWVSGTPTTSPCWGQR